jgi:hypothetical protein
MNRRHYLLLVVLFLALCGFGPGSLFAAEGGEQPTSPATPRGEEPVVIFGNDSRIVAVYVAFATLVVNALLTAGRDLHRYHRISRGDPHGVPGQNRTTQQQSACRGSP